MRPQAFRHWTSAPGDPTLLRLKACTLIVCMLLVQSFKKVGTSSQTLLQAQTRPHGQCTVHARFLRQKIRSRTIARLLKSAHKTLKNTDRIKRRIQREVDIQPIMKHLPSPEFSRNSEKCLFGVTRIKRSGLIQIWRRGGRQRDCSCNRRAGQRMEWTEAGFQLP